MTDLPDLDQFVRDLVLGIWVAAAAQRQRDPGAPNPEDVERRTRAVLERCPPVKTATGYDVGAFLHAAAAEFGFDPIALIEGFSADKTAIADEDAAAVQAAEDLLRGNT